MAASQMSLGRRPGDQSGALAAAVVTFVVVALVISLAVIISAPTGGLKLFPFDKYISGAWQAAEAFVAAGIVLGVIMGILASLLAYRVWGNRAHRQEALTAYLFLAPYLIIALVFTVGVLLFALYISFYSYNIFQPPTFVGMANFVKAFTATNFLEALYNVFFYAVIVTTLQTALALFVAALLNSKMPARNFFRTIFYAPSVTSSVVISLIFWWLYLKTGYINFGIAQLLGIFGIHWANVDWLNNPNGIFQLIASAFHRTISFNQWYLHGPSVTWLALMVQNIYTTVPTFMLMFLAALQDIPPSVYEAAEIDGATGWQQFWRITVPMLRPAILLVVVLGTIGTLQIFDQVNILTKGGPLNTTLSPVYLVYREALGTEGAIQFGYASSMAFILAIIIFAFTVLQRRVIESGTEQY